jgi:hypothetical protein
VLLIASGRARPALAISVLAFTLLAGCASQGPQLPSAPPVDDARSTGPDYVVSLSECRHADHTMYTTRADYRPDFPPPVRPFDAVREFALLDFLDCRQAVVGEGVQQGFQLAMFASQIADPDPSLGLRHAWFVFQAYSNSPSFVDNLSRLGLPVGLMEHASSTITPLAAGSSFASYELALPSPGQADYRVDGLVGTDPSRDVHRAEGYYFESQDGLRVLRAGLDVKEGQDAGGTIRFGPGSYWSAHASADAWDVVNGYQAQAAGELRVGLP